MASLSAQDGVVQQVKKRHWHSTFGDIEVIEPIYRRKADGKLERPFATVAGVVCRGYSRPLQRVMADFGADLPFAGVGEKLKEHDGIVVAPGAARRLTYRHARPLESEDILPRVKPKLSAMTLIAEADGSMIPVVRSSAGEESEPGDKRKRRALSWKRGPLEPGTPPRRRRCHLCCDAGRCDRNRREPQASGACRWSGASYPAGYMVWVMAHRGLPSRWNVSLAPRGAT